MRLYSIDTSAWIEYFRATQSGSARRVEELFVDESSEIGIDGVVLAELLQGVRTGADRTKLRERLDGFPFFRVDRSIFQRAGTMNADLAAAGIHIPVSDALIAATALCHNAIVITADEHFTYYKDLQCEFFRPA